jgi:DNA polymerase-1
MDKIIKRCGHLGGVIELAELAKESVTQRSVYDTVAAYLVDDRVHPMIGIRQSAGRWSVTQPGLTVLGKRNGRVVEREVFLPEPDEVLLAFDLSQIDARALAALSQDHEYVKLFRSGQDLHEQVALRVFGDAGMREDAKSTSHGWNYGLSVNGMVRNGIDRELAEQFDREMKLNFPRLCEWRTEVRRQAEAGELLDNGFGRKMRPDPVRAWTQAPALMGQGCARDLLMEGLLRLPLDIVKMIKVQVHDEILVSVPGDAVEDVTDTVLKALQFEWRGVPIIADISKPGLNWSQCYAK